MGLVGCVVGCYGFGMGFTEIEREGFREILSEIANTCMPFGRYGPEFFPPRGVPLFDLPPEYLQWFSQRGFPTGRLGELMEAVYEIKEAGMDCLFDPMREALGGRRSVRKRKNKRGDVEKFKE